LQRIILVLISTILSITVLDWHHALVAQETRSDPKPTDVIKSIKATLLRNTPVTGKIARAVAITPDGQTIIVGTDEGKIQLWALKTGKLIRALDSHTNWTQSVTISPDGKVLASCSPDGTIKFWKLDGTLLQTLQNIKGVYSLAWSPDGRFLLSGDNAGQIKIWTRNAKLVRTINAHKGNIVAIAISGKGIIASRSFVSIDEKEQDIKLWNLNTGKLIRNISAGSVGGINSLAISRDGNLLAGYSITNKGTPENSNSTETVKIWNLRTGENIYTLTPKIDRPHAIAFSPDNKTVAIGGFSNQIEIWDIDSQAETSAPTSVPESNILEIKYKYISNKLITIPSKHQTYSLIFSQDGKKLISSGSQSFTVWSIQAP
jgi:WD40 repeat protein